MNMERLTFKDESQIKNFIDFIGLDKEFLDKYIKYYKNKTYPPEFEVEMYTILLDICEPIVSTFGYETNILTYKDKTKVKLEPRESQFSFNNSDKEYNNKVVALFTVYYSFIIEAIKFLSK